MNTEASASGSYEAFRLGVEAAVEWWNYTAAASGKRQIALDSCAPTDEVSTIACADELVQTNTALVHGVDLYSDLSLPVIEASGLPVLGGVAVRAVDADAGNAGLDIGGPPAAHAALAALAADRQLTSVVVLHDASDVSRELINRFTRPVLQDAGIVAAFVEVPPNTTDATGVVAAASVELGEAWLVATSTRSCGAIAASRRHFGVTTPVIWGTGCTTPAVLDNYGDLMMDDTVAFELIEPRLLDFVNSELRAGYELANQVLLQYDPVLVDDPLAIRGWLVGTRLTQTLDRSGGDLSAARDVRAPNPISAGEIACGTNPTAICAADIMFFGWNGSTVEGPMVVVDGLAEPVAQTSGVAPTSG
ncbi:MAG: hypothetical protein R2770_21850 [Acidimicrobiales bacterium]